MDETIRYNCKDNDNHIIFHKYLKNKNEMVVDEIWMGSDLGNDEICYSYNDLLDALLIVVGGRNLLLHAAQRLEVMETEDA